MTVQTPVDSTVSQKGQTTLPKAVREALRLHGGDQVRYFIRGDEVRMARVCSVMDLAGMLHDPDRPTVSIEEMNQAIAEGWARDESAD